MIEIDIMPIAIIEFFKLQSDRRSCSFAKASYESGREKSAIAYFVGGYSQKCPITSKCLKAIATVLTYTFPNRRSRCW
ncbi:hypothetical protein IQ276_005235 [Desmonostoc muscorum LEGE 12446]|uniref:Uncharacterized protein n=2 Tax=Desmonostoc muscorum TaxID=1179 RepID=A0A8J7A9W9_DESMC|nr:hypothetical protein [Desmonostoc muscorum LEGE 12446]